MPVLYYKCKEGKPLKFGIAGDSTIPIGSVFTRIFRKGQNGERNPFTKKELANALRPFRQLKSKPFAGT